MLHVLFEAGQGIPQAGVHKWFNLSVSGRSVSDGAFARLSARNRDRSSRGWHRRTGTDRSCVSMDQADSRSTD